MNGLCLMLALLMSADDPAAAADKRPEWATRESWSEPPVRYRVVASELWATPEEALDDALDRAAPIVRDFAAQADRRIKAAWQVPPRVLHDRIVTEEFLEKVDWTYGPMYRAHLLLELSPAKRDVLLGEWRQVKLQQRVGQLGAGLGFVLVCLAALLGYLRLDEATRGYYTGWLRAGLVALVAGSAAVLYTWVA
jgi:hypothetical protein